MKQNSFTLTIMNSSGQPYREYTAPDGRTFIVGRPGDVYTIKIERHILNRFLAVVSVDGLSVLTGKPARRSDNGFIVTSFLGVKGWQVDEGSAAEFVFSENSDSYARKIGASDDMGIIATAIYEENKPEPVTEVDFGCTKGLGHCNGEKGLGTGFGSSITSNIERKHFDRGPLIAEMAIFYTDIASLQRMGLVVEQQRPQGFPADTYCTPPSDWRG